ncbi:hypothetical protein Tco_0103625 [Tanacetum coccineum]
MLDHPDHLLDQERVGFFEKQDITIPNGVRVGEASEQQLDQNLRRSESFSQTENDIRLMLAPRSANAKHSSILEMPQGIRELAGVSKFSWLEGIWKRNCGFYLVGSKIQEQQHWGSGFGLRGTDLNYRRVGGLRTASVISRRHRVPLGHLGCYQEEAPEPDVLESENGGGKPGGAGAGSWEQELGLLVLKRNFVFFFWLFFGQYPLVQQQSVEKDWWKSSVLTLATTALARSSMNLVINVQGIIDMYQVDCNNSEIHVLLDMP